MRKLSLSLLVFVFSLSVVYAGGKCGSKCKPKKKNYSCHIKGVKHTLSRLKRDKDRLNKELSKAQDEDLKVSFQERIDVIEKLEDLNKKALEDFKKGDEEAIKKFWKKAKELNSANCTASHKMCSLKSAVYLKRECDRLKNMKCKLTEDESMARDKYVECVGKLQAYYTDKAKCSPEMWKSSAPNVRKMEDALKLKKDLAKEDYYFQRRVSCYKKKMKKSDSPAVKSACEKYISKCERLCEMNKEVCRLESQKRDAELEIREAEKDERENKKKKNK